MHENKNKIGKGPSVASVAVGCGVSSLPRSSLRQRDLAVIQIIGLLKGGCNLEEGAELGGEQWALAHEIGGLLFSRGHLVAGPQHLFTGQGDRNHMLLGLGVIPALDLQAFTSRVLTDLA